MKKIRLIKTFGIILSSFLGFNSQAQSISSTLHSRTDVVEDVSSSFQVSTTSGSMTGSTVKIFITLSDTNLSSTVHAEYYNPLTTSYESINFVSGVAQFGPVAGFPFFDATSDFRVVFDSATTYDYTLEVQDSVSAVIASASESVTVNAYVSASIYSNLNGQAGWLEGIQNDFTIYTNGGNDTGTMIWVNMKLADPTLANSAHLEYFDGTAYQPLFFGVNGDTRVGDINGINLLTSDSIMMRVVFDSATTYDYTLEIEDVSNSEILSMANESITIGAYFASSISGTLNGRVGLSTGNQDTFSVSVIAGSLMGEIVTLKSQLADSLLSDKIHLEYFDGANYQPLTFNSDGSLIFGPVVGFPLADATTEFRVSFDSAATYDYTFEIVKMSDASVLAVSNESVTVGQTIPAVILSTLNGRTGLTTGIQDTFSVSVIAGSMTGEMVTLKSQLTDSLLSSKIHLEYFDGTTYQPLTFNSDGTLAFGPPTGFPLADATTAFRVTFDSAATYNYSFQVINFNDQSVVAESNESVTVDQYIQATVLSTINGRTGMMVGAQDTFSVSTTAGSEANRMVLISLQLDDASLYNSINLEYFDGTTYQPLAFSTGGTLVFGPTGGFPLADATTMFRVIFDSAVTYNYTLSILDATTSDIIGSVNESVTVNSIPVPATISTSLNGRTGVKTNTPVNFIASVVANSDSNKTVQMKISLLNAGLSNFVDLKFFDGSSFQTLTFDNNGVALYGSTGFALADQSVTFSIEFDTATTVDYKFELIELTNNNVIANSTESVVVERVPTGGINFNNKIDFAMMPNPANNFVAIDYHKDAHVNIYDITGKLIRTAEISSNHTLEVADLNNGTYYVQLLDGVNFSTKKLVIIH